MLDHLDGSLTAELPLLSALPGEKASEIETSHVHPALQEFEADECALLRPAIDTTERRSRTDAALLWFGYLDMYERVAGALTQRPPSHVQTHPAAGDRANNVGEVVGVVCGLEPTRVSAIESIRERANEFLTKDVAANREMYEMYGSIYLVLQFHI